VQAGSLSVYSRENMQTEEVYAAHQFKIRSSFQTIVFDKQESCGAFATKHFHAVYALVIRLSTLVKILKLYRMKRRLTSMLLEDLGHQIHSIGNLDLQLQGMQGHAGLARPVAAPSHWLLWYRMYLFGVYQNSHCNHLCVALHISCGVGQYVLQLSSASGAKRPQLDIVVAVNHASHSSTVAMNQVPTVLRQD
jgi:hypothetical protein